MTISQFIYSIQEYYSNKISKKNTRFIKLYNKDQYWCINMYHSNLLSVNETLEIINKTVNSTHKEVIDLFNGNSRVLAEELKVKLDVPPFNRSAMDGYAVIASDLSNASNSKLVSLKVVDEIGAGDVSKHVLKNGEAIRIATGAKMPVGADAIVMDEDVDLDGEKICIKSTVEVNNDVALKGEDLKFGEIILSVGQVLGPHHLSVIASAGYSKIKVFKKPRIGVIITGNELTDPTTELEPGMIINSNKYALKGVIEDSLAFPFVKHCKDDAVELRSEVVAAVREYDAVITTGGTAISKGDLIVDIVESLGEVPVHGVAIKPGKPFGFGMIDEKPIFMLSGYPVAVAVQYDILVRNSILKMQNINQIFKYRNAVTESDVRSSSDKYNVIRANFKDINGSVAPVKTKAGINKSILMSNSYIIAEEGVGKIKKGDKCRVLMYSSLKI
jgi:molybdopterin molybdotransferase